MKPILQAVGARLVVGHLDADLASQLLSTIDGKGRPVTFALAEPDGLRLVSAVPAGMAAETARAEPLRWGKLVLETVAHEAMASARRDACDAIVDGLRVAHRRLGAEGFDLIARGSSGVGFCAAAMAEDSVQLVIVPPAQVFVVHQGIALSVPQSDEVGRGIWMRDDLRAEIFAGVGGVHEPDIRVYDATIGPGDSLVLASSTLARMLTEDDVRLAVAYEDAASGAERLKQLAIQRGVDAGVALVVEIAGVLDMGTEAPSGLSGPITLGSMPRPLLRVEMPPVGSIFSTARDWLLEAIDRAPGADAGAPSTSADIQTDQVSWPVRPQPGAWRKQFASTKHVAINRPPESPSPDEPSVEAVPDPAMDAGLPGAGEAGLSDEQAYAELSSGWRRPAARSWRAPRLGSYAARSGRQTAASVSAAFGSLRHRLAAFDIRGQRHLAMPLAVVALVLLVVIGGVKVIQAQQARQVRERFDSLVAAAAQLETQARSESDRNQAQGLVRRAQALLDQAATLQPGQSRVISLRKDLQSDLDRLDNVVALPSPVEVANFGSAARDVTVGPMAVDGSAFYVIDTTGQRILQLTNQTKQVSVAVEKGQKSGTNQLGIPKLIAARDTGLLILDSNRTLWSYSAANHRLDQVGLKSADSWKEATAMAAYGPNLYVLDATVGNIFRYVSRDGLFTEPPSRFLPKDDPEMLKHAVGLVIDGSIWVATSDGQVLKLENSSRQPFAVTGLPQPVGKASGIYTQVNFDSLYLWDASSNRIVRIAKDGRYLQQFSASLPASATAFWPDEANRTLYLAAANKLLQFRLPN